jgi:O-antigen/teichoic acid export membrane protein
MGKNYELSVPTLMILTSGTFVLLSHRMSVDLLYGLGRQNFVAGIYSIESIAVFGLSLLLSFKYGLAGVALGVSVPMIIVRAVFQAKYVCKMINVSVRHYYARCILRPWAVSIALAVIASALRVNGYINSWVSFLLVSAIVTLVYGTVTYLAVIESSDKKQINSWMLGVLGLVPANR